VTACARARHWTVVLCLGLTLVLAGCHSYHIDSTIENHTGAPIQLLEVDYPSASFGTDRLSEGEAFHYRFQVLGSGPVTVTYIGPGGIQIHVTGPTLAERQQGQLDIVLLPGGKVLFGPKLAPPSQP
jgi:hypothetical protein